MEAGQTTSNAFARVILFYYTYLRSKLVPADLEKIAKKYCTKPDKLLSDLRQKYSFVIPEYVYIDEIHRCCSIFKVPASYSRLIPELPQDTEFDSQCDVYCADFDPLMSLVSGKISISYVKARTLDNLSRTYAILPNYVPSYNIANKPVAPQSSSTGTGSATSADSPRSSESLVPRSKHLFEMIAEASLQTKASRNGPEGGADGSPLALLYQYMRKHVRVRIILRRNASVRGSLDAYIIAFDRHYNMLLSDVDEEYITNSQKKRAMVMGRFRSQNNVLHRHLPQLILRGDLVVVVFRKPS